MHVVTNLQDAAEAQLRAVKRGVYVCKNVSGWNPGMFTFGVIGNISDNSSLAARLKEHEENKSNLKPRNNKKKNFRHSVSPFRRFWACDLTGWSADSAELAEELLYVEVACRFSLVSDSCFEKAKPAEVFRMLRKLVRGLREIAAMKNHQWCALATLPRDFQKPRGWSPKSKTLAGRLIRTAAARDARLTGSVPSFAKLNPSAQCRIKYGHCAIQLRGNHHWKRIPPRSRSGNPGHTPCPAAFLP